MTLAPRIEVYTNLACRAVNHTSSPSPSSPTPFNLTLLDTSLHETASLDYNLTTLTFTNAGHPSNDCSADPKVQGRAARIQACPFYLLSIRSYPDAPVQPSRPRKAS